MKEIIYSFILCKIDGTYLGWSKAEEMPPCGDPKNMQWHKWGKGLPADIEEARDENGNSLYKYVNGELVK